MLPAVKRGGRCSLYPLDYLPVKPRQSSSADRTAHFRAFIPQYPSGFFANMFRP
jgi:hypothetical protein